jgi:hypothetical protein
MNKEMPSYQQFLKDEELRATMSKGKTKKRILGHLYSTLTGGNVFLGTFIGGMNLYMRKIVIDIMVINWLVLKS